MDIRRRFVETETNFYMVILILIEAIIIIASLVFGPFMMGQNLVAQPMITNKRS